MTTAEVNRDTAQGTCGVSTRQNTVWKGQFSAECGKVSDNSHLKYLHTLHKTKMHTLWTQTAQAHEQRHKQQCDYEDCFSLSYKSHCFSESREQVSEQDVWSDQQKAPAGFTVQKQQDKLQINTTEVPSMQDCD